MRTLIVVLFLARVAAAQDLLSNVEQVGSESTYEKYGHAVFDRDRRLCIVRTSTTAEWKDRILLRCRHRCVWSQDERIDRGDGVESNASLVIDGQRKLRAFWHGRRGGEWGIYSWTEGRREQKIASGLHPTVEVDLDDRIWVAYEVPKQGGFAIEVIAQQGNTWSKPLRIESSGSDRRPALAKGWSGHVWLAWDSTRTGNYDIFLARINAPGTRRSAPGTVEQVQITAHATIDDSPSIASVMSDNSVWIVWNGMRSHAGDRYRADRHNGDAFIRRYRQGKLLAPPGVAAGALPGQVSFGSVNKSIRDAVDSYWHWKQTQNYPVVFNDSVLTWIIWRTDATGAHNFDLWARIHDGSRWSPEMHLTTFSPGRDEWPSVTLMPDGDGYAQITWEGQLLPKPGEESSFLGGDVDAYNTVGMPNVILTASLSGPTGSGWTAAPLAPAPPEVLRPDEMNEPPAPGSKGATTSDGRWKIFFGDPHSHTILSDAKTGLPDQILSLSRDAIDLDFAVVSDHMEMGRLQPSEYAELRDTAAIFNEPGRFVSLTGWEWTAGPKYGHRVIVYRGEGGRPLSWASAEGDTIEELYEHVRKDHGVMSPHHTGQAMWGRWNPDAHHDEELEPNFEIASWHGRFEYYGNPWEGRRQIPGHQYQDTLRRGRHVGVMAASDTHHLSPGEGGLTAVLAERLDRESIFDAIRRRRNYATTGARIVLEFQAADAPMGSRITASGPLELRVRVEGTAPVDRVEIVRNLVDTFAAVRVEQNPSGPDGLFVIYEPRAPQGVRRHPAPDTRRLDFIVTDVETPPGETSYYVRVTQTDGHQAWSSPIWVTRQR